MARKINDIDKFARIAREEMLKCNDKLVADDSIPVVLNPRLSRALARCGTTWNKDGLIKKQVIEVQKDYYFADKISDQQLIGTLIHEYLHSMFPRDGHEGNWKYWADYISSHSDYTITRVSEDIGFFRNDYSDFKYALVCPKCNMVLKLYKSTTKQILTPHRYSHSICNTPCEAQAITTELLENLDSPITLSKPKEELPHPEQLSLF